MSFLEIDGHRCYVIHEGDGPPFVMLHGFPLDHSMWQAQRTAFKSTHRVVIPDLRGFGKSLGGTPIAALADHADDLAHLLDRLRIRQPVILCGLSMGGYIAFRFLERYPSRVAKLILCDTKALADSAEAAANRLAMAEKVLQEGSRIVVAAMSSRLFGTWVREQQPKIMDEIRDVMLATLPETIAAAQRAMAARPDSTPLLATITVPTLVLVGEQDLISPPDEMRAMAAAIPGSEFAVIPQAGHMAPQEQPLAVNGVIRKFLNRLL